MGQQQLLLIILGVIIVGVAIMVGLTLFARNAADQNRDALWTDLNNICARAQAFYRRPGFLGGGNRSFQNFTIPTFMDRTDNGVYRITDQAQSYAEIRGVGTEMGDNGDTVFVTMRVEVDTMWVIDSN